MITIPTMSERKPCGRCAKVVMHQADGSPMPHDRRFQRGVRCVPPMKKETPVRPTPDPDAKPAAVPALGADGKRVAIPAPIVRWVRRRDRDRCARCGRDEILVPLELHHIKEVSAGGWHDPDNLDLLCEPCHSRVTWGLRGDMTYEEYKTAPSGGAFELLVVQSRRDDERGASLRAQLAGLTALGLVDLLQAMQDQYKRRP